MDADVFLGRLRQHPAPLVHPTMLDRSVHSVLIVPKLPLDPHHIGQPGAIDVLVEHADGNQGWSIHFHAALILQKRFLFFLQFTEKVGGVMFWASHEHPQAIMAPVSQTKRSGHRLFKHEPQGEAAIHGGLWASLSVAAKMTVC